MRIRPKLILRGAVCTICLLLASGARIPEAEAVVLVDLIGTIDAAAYFTPGIKLLAQPVTISGEGNFGNFVLPNNLPSGSGIKYAKYTIDGTGTIGCLSSAGANGTVDLSWRDKDNIEVTTSTVTWSVTLGTFLVPTVTATVTQGLFAGDTGIPVIVGGNPIGVCNLPLLGPTMGVNVTGTGQFLH